MALGRQRRASILIRPDPVLSILSPRSSQTTQSESHVSLKRHDWTKSLKRCGQIPEGCKRCDDECAWREGKSGREDY